VPSSLELSHEIEAVQQELSELRSRVDEDSSTFAALEQQMAELRENLAKTRSSVNEREHLLAEKQAELVEAQRLEVLANYQEDLQARRKASNDVTRAAATLLGLLEAYDDQTLRLRERLRDMLKAFGRDERVTEVEAALAEEPAELQEAWDAVVGAIGWRLRSATNGESVDREADVVLKEPERVVKERRRALIREYFGNR
jgi:chromosome segregation ATPase